MGSHHYVYPRLTPSRERFLRDLIEMGVGEPYVSGTTRHHLLKIGWIDGVFEIEGRQSTMTKFNEEFAGVPDRWSNVKFLGVTITDEGRRALQQNGERDVTEDDIEKLKEFGSYRGVIERTRVSNTLFVESGDNGEKVYIVGRRHASAIVSALHKAGYEIVRRS